MYKHYVKVLNADLHTRIRFNERFLLINNVH